MAIVKKTNQKNHEVGRKISIDPTPHRAVEDYFELKSEVPIVKKKPEEDKGRTTPISDLIRARRQLEEANASLRKKREDIANWQGDMGTKWEDLKMRQLQLRGQFIRFHSFVKENHEKRVRAMEKITKEIENQERYEKEIATVESKMEHFKAVEQQLDAQVAEYQVYGQFLKDVVAKWPGATEITEVLNRYEALVSTRNGLSGQQAEALASIQTSRTKLTTTAGEQAQTIMGLHTLLAELRVKHQEAHFQATKWNAILSRIRVFAAKKAIEIEQVRSSCLDLYKNICKLRKEPMGIAETDTEEQLTYIARHIQTLRQAVSLVQDKLAKNARIETNALAVSSTQAKV